MNKKALIEAIAEKTENKKGAVAEVVNSVFDRIMDEVKAGHNVKITGFGTFQKKQKAATVKRNLHTGKKIDIPAQAVVKFKACREFKALVK